MTAVDPVRLRFQIDELLSFFNQPPAFHRQLQDLFSRYANRTLRFGETPKALPLIPMYHLPAPVPRQLELDLQHPIQENPQEALALADELWADEYYEVRQIAIYILSILPLENSESITNRFDQWLTPELDPTLLSELLSRGTQSLQSLFPKVWEQYIGSLFNRGDSKMISIGIKALRESISKPAFINLPAVFRLISPYLQNPQPVLEKDLLSLLTALIKKSPNETAYFLQQTASISESPILKRMIKQSLSLFPADLQQALRISARK